MGVVVGQGKEGGLLRAVVRSELGQRHTATPPSCRHADLMCTALHLLRLQASSLRLIDGVHARLSEKHHVQSS